MALITKPDFTYVWASGGAVVAPNDTKKQQGWVAEAPPFQYDNWLQNRQDQMLAHINQRGICAWDGLTEYEAGGLSYVQGSDGKVYKSVAGSGPATTVQDPTTDLTDTYWTVAFASQDLATESVPGIVEIATASEAQAFTANKIIDGAKLASAFMGVNVSLTTNGYQKLPSGLIIQWGVTASFSHAAGTTQNVTVTFPVAFPAARLALILSHASVYYTSGWTSPESLSMFTAQSQAMSVSGSGPISWLAIGY